MNMPNTFLEMLKSCHGTKLVHLAICLPHVIKYGIYTHQYPLKC